VLFNSRRERRLWLSAAVLIVIIDSTLYLARGIAEYLRDRNLLRLTVFTLVGLGGLAVAIWARGQDAGPRGWAVLALGGVAFGVAMSRVSPVEVKFHFVEYGLLGALFYAALAERGVRWPALCAVLLTGLAGWLDEGIQYLLPNRWYDLQDVAINAVAGALAIATLVLLERVRQSSGEAEA